MAPIRLIDTAGMTEERWLECRKHGPAGDIPYTIGGSDTAVVLGISPWRSPYELYLVKKGLMQEPVKSNGMQLMMGHLLEPIVAQVYEKVTGNRVITDTMMYQHPDHLYALANLDYRVVTADDIDAASALPSGTSGILECKTCSYRANSGWDDGGFPAYYECQVRYYMGIMDLPFTDFAALWGNNPDNDFVHPRVLRNMTLENQLFEAMDEFIWRLENDKPPEDPADGCNDPKAALANLARIYAQNGGRPIDTIELPSDMARYARIIERLTEENAELSRKKKANDDAIDKNWIRLTVAMQEYEHAVIETTDNRYLIDLKSSSKTTVDSKLLKKEEPAIFDKYSKKSESMRKTLKVVPQTE
jgi:putative phage-type endonuclease